ncbi:MAG: 16S rRNA (guanine(527)-N(7))-methyltransferase RsmG [Candidatus Coproplasma sp.]
MDIEKYGNLIKGEYKERFKKLKSILVDNNKKFNLTAIIDDEGIFIKHFLDSVVGESLIKEGAYVAEIGSGGGFPSLPLKIVRDDLKFLLVESTGKKCNHLNEAVALLEMRDMQVFCGRAEDCAKDAKYREKFDCSVARAVARLNTLCEYCLPFVKVGGYFIAYKGDVDEEVNEAQKAVKLLGGKLERVEKYTLPDGDKRSLVVIKKVAPTPLKYPRGQGKERKSPIV